MKTIKNILLAGSDSKPVSADIFFEDDGAAKPAIIYAHGFNGFKDWGNADLFAREFAEAGFVFIKFNFSHNGTTPETPEDFTDLEAYAQNNYTIELADLEAVIEWVCSPVNPYHEQIDSLRVALIGHSMGGGISLIKAAADSRIKAIATWASISECKTPWGSWPEQKMQEWKASGVQYLANSRTKQEMPLRYQLYRDYQDNAARLDIEAAVKRLSIPQLICHGTEDTSVPVASARLLLKWRPEARLFTIASDHVFGRKHPWHFDELPVPMNEVVSETIRFFKDAF